MSNTPICIALSNSGWLSSYAFLPRNSTHNTYQHNIKIIMIRIILVRFLPCDNGWSCELHPFECGNLLVLDREDYGMDMLLRLRMMVTNELSCYIINSDGSNGCHVCFVACEYAARENGRQLDGTTICITNVYKSDDENHLMRRL